MNIGFTCTRRGMSAAQCKQLVALLDMLSGVITGDAPVYYEQWQFHHGDEPNGDRHGAEIAARRGMKPVPHPPKTFTAKDLLARNQDIVDASDFLIAAPRTDQEELRSGTWATVRRARSKGIPVIFLSRGKG